MKLALLYCGAFMKGGYPRDFRWLAGALKRKGIDVSVFTSHKYLERDGLEQGISLRETGELAFACRKFDVVHLFGFFLPKDALIAMVCALRGVPVIVSPCSHLLPLHLVVRPRKKNLFITLAWKPWMRRVAAFHVFSQLEAESVRKLAPKANLFEGTLGVFPMDGPMDGAVGAVSARHDATGTKSKARKVLFFGRNDVYQKGLDILLNGYAAALKRLGPEGRNLLKLTIAGQPWKGSDCFLPTFAQRLGIADAVTIVGKVDERTKARLLAEADYLVFLSRWDGPPRPIREAIASGTPVIVSAETNMGELVEKFGAGLQVGLNPEDVGRGLARAAMDSSLLEQSRLGAERLQRYLSWDRVAEDYIKGYEEAFRRCRVERRSWSEAPVRFDAR